MNARHSREISQSVVLTESSVEPGNDPLQPGRRSAVTNPRSCASERCEHLHYETFDRQGSERIRHPRVFAIDVKREPEQIAAVKIH